MAENQQRTPTDRSRWLSVALCIGAVIYTFAGAWMVTAGPADPVEHTAAFIAHLVSPWMMASYAVAVAFIGFGIWHLHGLSSGLDGRDIGSVMRQTGIRLALVFAVVIVSLSAIGWLYIRDIRTAAYAERSRQLDLVARLQAQQIGKWLVARLLDSERLAASLARLPLERLPADKDLVQGIDLLFAATRPVGIDIDQPAAGILAAECIDVAWHPADRAFVEHHEILGRREADHDLAQRAPFVMCPESHGFTLARRCPRSG